MTRVFARTCLVIALIAGSASAADVAPLYVQLHLEGAPYAGENCVGGDWTLTWRGELPAESDDPEDLLTSHTSFDSTHESAHAGSPAQLRINPLTCRDDSGEVQHRATISGGTRTVQAVASLNHNPAFQSPSFSLYVEDAGDCRVSSPSESYSIGEALIQFRAPIVSALVPTFGITLEELQEGFTKRFDVAGHVITSVPMCMGTEITRGELTVGYKRDPREPQIRLSGCAHLPRGGSTRVEAAVEPSGGSLRFSAEPASALKLVGGETSVDVTGATPARATLKGEYTYKGETASATLAASSLELISVNDGAALPKLGVLGVDGMPHSKVYTFSLKTNPDAAGDLLIFNVEDEALASVNTHRQSISIQPLRDGRTRLLASTTCGAPIGEPIEVEIATCDDEVRGEIVRRRDQARRRTQEIVRRITQLTADEEFDRAASEIDESTADLALRTAELIAATLTGSQATAVRQGRATAASLQQLEAAQNLWSVHGIINDANSGNIASAAWGAYVQSLNSWVSSALKSAMDAGLAAQQFGRDLGTLFGVAEQLEELSRQHDEAIRALHEIERILHRCDKLPPPKAPPPKKSPQPPAPPQPEPPPTPIDEPPAPNVTPPSEIETAPEPPPSGPVAPPSTPPGGAPLCLRGDETSSADALRVATSGANAYQQDLQRATQVFQEMQAVIAEMQQASALPASERTQRLTSLAPRYNAAIEAFFALGEISRAHEARLTECTENGWQATVKKLKTQY